MRRRWVAAAGALAVVAAGFLAAGELRSEGERWVPVARRDLVLGVEVEGVLEAVESAQLGPPQVDGLWNFKISRLAPEGSEVEVGQGVLSFDTTELEQSLQRMLAERDSAQKTLEKTRTDFQIQRRAQELRLAEARAALRRAELKLDVPAEVAARRELEAARIDHRLAQLEIELHERGLEHLEESTSAQIASLEEKRDWAARRVEEIEQQIASMTVRAPRSGTLIYLSDWGGEKRKVGDSVWKASKVVEIPDLERMRASLVVDEAAVGRLAVGQRARLRLDAYPDREHPGVVRSIRGTVQRKSWRDPQKIVRLEVELDETDVERMRPGMRVRGEVEVERLEDVLVVPLSAVHPRADGASVVVRSGFGRRWVKPVFGRRNSELIEVVSGLEAGDRVLAAGEAG